MGSAGRSAVVLLVSTRIEKEISRQNWIDPDSERNDHRTERSRQINAIMVLFNSGKAKRGDRRGAGGSEKGEGQNWSR